MSLLKFVSTCYSLIQLYLVFTLSVPHSTDTRTHICELRRKTKAVFANCFVSSALPRSSSPLPRAMCQIVQETPLTADVVSTWVLRTGSFADLLMLSQLKRTRLLGSTTTFKRMLRYHNKSALRAPRMIHTPPRFESFTLTSFIELLRSH